MIHLYRETSEPLNLWSFIFTFMSKIMWILSKDHTLWRFFTFPTVNISKLFLWVDAAKLTKMAGNMPTNIARCCPLFGNCPLKYLEFLGFFQTIAKYCPNKPYRLFGYLFSFQIISVFIFLWSRVTRFSILLEITLYGGTTIVLKDLYFCIPKKPP